MEKKEIVQGLYMGILVFDKANTIKMAQAAIDQDLDIPEIIQQAMTPAIVEVGKRFEAGKLYLPELQLSADVFSRAMEVLHPKLLELKINLKPKGRVIIGTVKGDMHSIGKDLVGTMLKVGGFEVTDLGIDVPTFTFLEQAEKTNANVIALSALLTTTMPAQREVIEALIEQKLRNKFKVIVGGAPIDQKWADKIGADAYGENAMVAVRLVDTLVA
ncbi:MAG: corrinoid protein [Deltaproteobacteria bacterium]|nr:corrinoid protein [Deltaproteobacteria bacterium]